MGSPSERASILELEYKHLWTYYIRTLDERARMFNLYFKVIGIPLVLNGAAVVIVRSIPDGSGTADDVFSAVIAILGLFFSLSYVAGVAAFLYYGFESANSRLYLLSMQAIRNLWRKENRSLRKALIIDFIRPEIKSLGGLIVWSRGSVFVLLNTAVGLTGLSFIVLFVVQDFSEYSRTSLVIGVTLFMIFSVLLHLAVLRIGTRGYAVKANIPTVSKQLRRETDELVGVHFGIQTS